MTDPLLYAGSALLGSTALGFASGFFLGRFEERHRIAEWLWDREHGNTWSLSVAIDRGEHRKPEPPQPWPFHEDQEA